MSKNETAWSYSRLESYELCPRKYHQESVLKNYPFQANAASDFGKHAHSKFEAYMRDGTPLPMDLQHHEKFIRPLAERDGDPLVEQKLALNRSFEPTGFFDSDVWVRAIIDFAKFHNGVGHIVDWKFGRRKDGFDQVDLMVAVMMAFKPDLVGVVGSYYWGKEKKFARKTYTRADISDIWTGYLPRVAKYEKAHQELDFPARANFLCKKYCPVTTCEFNGA